MRTIRAVLAVGAVLIALPGPIALAAKPREVAPGVFVDPNSPAAKEYALPIQQARSTGASPSASNGKSGASPLFGAGIARQTTTPATVAKKPASAGTRARPAAVGATASVARPSDPAPARATTTGSSSGGGTLALIGGGVAILALGGLGGVILRRRRSFEPSSDRHVG